MWFYYCYYSGHVSVEPYIVSCYVSGYFAGSQIGGWATNPDGTYGYSSCAVYESREEETGPHEAEDAAEDQFGGLLAYGTRNWFP